ncbi:MAG: methyltransferase [Bryobacterales bacterium]|nr:methyltransferase [Bryobacterales bacterium]
MNNETERAAREEKLRAPLPVGDATLGARIAEGLLRLGYTGEAMRAAVPETADGESSIKMNQAMVAERVGTSTPLGCLLRAFLLRVATPEEPMRRAVGDAFFDLCEEAQLWTRVEGGVVGSVVFLEDEKMFLLSDHTTVRLGEVSMYWVMSIGTSTVIVSESIARRPYEKMLDLCCGGGIQAFYLAPFAKRVVAIDRNPRALNFGRFGAAMNGFPQIEFRESDCYSAVEGEQFDLIACNPPYVMTPDRQAYYRDGGMGGDRFSERILRETAAYLAEGGFAHMTCDVGTMAGREGETRLREWLDGNGCDVVALQGKRLGPAEYAKAWMKADSPEYAAAEVERWVEHFGELQVTAIQNYLVILRKRTKGAKNWFHVDTLAPTRKGQFGHQIARMFACQDLVRRSPAEIWEAKLRLAPDMRMVPTMRPEGGRWMTDSVKLTFAEGLISEFEVEPRTANLLLLYDGTRKSEAVLEKIAAAMGQKAGELKSEWIGYLKHLIGNGILEPVGK